MSDFTSNICESCECAFTRTKFKERFEVVHIVPFHERPWDALQALLDLSQDSTSSRITISNCDFCAFVVALGAANALVNPTLRSFIDALRRSNSARYTKSQLGIFLYTGYSYAGHISADLSLQRDKIPYHAQICMRLFEPNDPRMGCHKPLCNTSRNTSSEESFACLSQWIDNCSQHHQVCNKLHSRKDHDLGWLPTRLIKIISRAGRDPEEIYLIETTEGELSAAVTSYATLSYCWGQNPSFTTLTQSNLHKLKSSGISVQALPSTFRDALAATIRLGLQYIWIDALCIIQDSQADWAKESVTMAKVYTFSAITLAAAASDNAEGGLFRQRDPAASNGTRLNLKWHVSNEEKLEGQFQVVPDDPWMKAVVQSPLLQRAWAFQERLLSRGTVFFAHDMLYWECGQLYACELYPSGGPWDLEYRYKRFDVADRLPMGLQPPDDGRFKHVYAAMLTSDGLDKGRDKRDQAIPEVFLYAWASIVTQYSIGELTYNSDKLVAIDGIAQQTAAIAPKEQYTVGLWRQPSLPLFLLWSTLKRTGHTSNSFVPSWSWASVNTRVSYDFLFRAQTDPEIAVEILDILRLSNHSVTTHLDLSHSSPFEEISSPSSSISLTLCGSLTEVSFSVHVKRNLGGPLTRSFWQKEMRMDPDDKFVLLRPLDWERRLAFLGKGLMEAYPSKIKFDRDIPKDWRIFALKVAGAQLKFPWAERVSVDCGVLLAPVQIKRDSNGRELKGKEYVKGLFVRVGYFEIAVDRMEMTGLNWWRDKTKLRQDLWKKSKIDEIFWQKWDGKDRYTITII